VDVLKFNLRTTGLRSNIGTSSVLADCSNTSTSSGNSSASSGNTSSVTIFISAAVL
nr:hypothetical protein [Tanacetum cinerariifolium]